MNKRICISGYYGFDNFGDETILKILVENLKEMHNVEEITVFSSTPEKTAKELNVKSVQTFSPKDIIVSLFNSTCLISGGGSLLQDITSKKSLIYYLLVLSIAQFFGKKTIIFAQGIGPVKNKILASLTAVVLKKANHITVRDENSLELLKSWGINANLCSDPVWNLKITSEKTDKIGIQLRTFPTLNEEFLNWLANAINNFYADKQIFIYSLQNKLDLEVCNRLKAKLKNAVVVENTSNEQVIKDLSSLDTLIAMRFHACLIAVKNNVKLLPINYDIKVGQLAKEFNLNCLSLNNLRLNNEIMEHFVKNNISYDKEKINGLKFDFEIIKKHL